jgi:hypothetical protein
MRYRDPKQVRTDLIQLIEKQIATLAKETCESLTEAELGEYEDRKTRIDELYESLSSLDSAA